LGARGWIREPSQGAVLGDRAIGDTIGALSGPKEPGSNSGGADRGSVQTGGRRRVLTEETKTLPRWVQETRVERAFRESGKAA